MSSSYINLIDNIPSGYDNKQTKSIKDCNKQANDNNKKYFISGNDITKTDYACYIGDTNVPFTTEPTTNPKYLYKTASNCNDNNFPTCLNDAQNTYFKDIKNEELIQMARILAYKNSMIYKQDYNTLLQKYMNKINRKTDFFDGKDILDDTEIENKSLVDRLFLINSIIKKRQLDELALSSTKENEKNKVSKEYTTNLDNIKSQIENEIINTNKNVKIIQYLKIITIISFILMIILILYYIIKNPKNKINNLNNIINF
jgi:hypothetical protein